MSFLKLIPRWVKVHTLERRETARKTESERVRGTEGDGERACGRHREVEMERKVSRE